MTLDEVLRSYRSGSLSQSEVRQMLRQRRETNIPLSCNQRGLWSWQQMYRHSSAYHAPVCVRVRGPLVVERLREAMQCVVRAHPMLRAVIEEEAGVPYQRVRPQSEPSFKHEWVQWRDEAQCQEELRRRVQVPFVLSESLLRVEVLSSSEQEHVVLLVVHHLVFDGRSAQLLLESLMSAYAALGRGETWVAAQAAGSYAQFVSWERQWLSSAAGEQQGAYWREQLSGALPVLRLSEGAVPQAAPVGATLVRQLPQSLSEQIMSQSRAAGVSAAVWLLGVYQLLLHRHTGQHDVIVGMPTLGRPQERFESVIGCFVNMLAIRSEVRGEQDFAAFVSQLQLRVMEAVDHGEYPFAQVVKDLRAARPAGQSPVFQVAYEYQNARLRYEGRGVPSELSLEAMAGIYQEGEYELVLEVLEGTHFELHWKYDAQRYEREGMQRMLAHYVQLLEATLGAPQASMGSYEWVTRAEREQILGPWNASELSYPRERQVWALIDEQAQVRPQAVAVVHEERTLTYAQLKDRSDALAQALRAQGVRSGELVGLCVERSIELVISLLGIMKAGAAYVPLDPHSPGPRLQMMLEDSGARWVLSQSQCARLLADAPVQCLLLDAPWPAPADEPSDIHTHTESALAYVMYTSGSTGVPKGVMISHRSLLNFLHSMQGTLGMKPGERWLAVTTYGFDISALELYLPLLSGGECWVCSSEVVRDAQRLKLQVERVKPQWMQATPTLWQLLWQVGFTNAHGTRILCGGEPLPPGLCAALLASGSEAWNLYGPTETTIWSTLKKLGASAEVTIGRPIANTQVLVLDPYGQLCPIGVVGELCIGGEGLAQGYWRQPALTQEKFIAHRLARGGRLYRTGDLGRWTSSGELQCLGRRDTQVKLRGHRIELAEIERCVERHRQVSQCAVVKSAGEHAQLRAFYVLKPGSEPLPSAALIEHVKLQLPEYMVPAQWIAREQLPQTANGKIDRAALGRDESAEVTSNEVITSTATEVTSSEVTAIETQVLSIWREVLRQPAITPTAGFFDSGGDSVLAVHVAQRIAKALACEFEVTTLFRHSSVRQIAHYIAALKTPLKAPERASSEASNAEPPRAASAHEPRAVESGTLPAYYDQSIAIIGISCQFPQAEDHREFWDNLLQGKESIERLSPAQARERGVPADVLEHPNYVAVCSSLAGKELFDASFFKVSARDAQRMDPQLRLLLQHAWKACEDAGYISQHIPQTSVFIASSHSGYGWHNGAPDSGGVIRSSDEYVSWLLSQSGTIPTLISHRLGLKGPSYAVHANCSSSLVGLHAAMHSLRSGESKYALVGAASLQPVTSLGYVHQPGLNFSSDGRVKTFDAQADGMLGGEGVAVLLLKRAREAIEDGDHIYALLRGVGLNNDGSQKAGFYAPSVRGQAEVIEQALRASGVDARTISYVEAHGTGTALGDPIEVAALREVYGQHGVARESCGLGSVKTNLGHLDTAAGLAGCIKVALSLQHEQLPPSLNYHSANPQLQLEQSPFYVVQRSQPWPAGAQPRRAGLSCFGIGGTNGHAILEEYRAPPKLLASAPLCLVPLSARTAERLKAYAQSLLSYLQRPQQVQAVPELGALAYTLQVGREAMAHRVIFTVRSIEELRDRLSAYVHDALAAGECLQGEVRDSSEEEGLLETHDARRLIEHWIAESAWSKLARAWVRGLTIEWRALYPHGTPGRLSLPTYPFAPERHWIEQAELAPLTRSSSQPRSSSIHPLLHRNTSSFTQHRFSSEFSGEEFFLADHRLRGAKLLPAVAYLEMARAAVSHAMAPGSDVTRMSITDVVWLRPLFPDDAAVHVSLYPNEDGSVEFEIHLDSTNDEQSTPVVHAQGRVWPSASDNLARGESIDIETLSAHCAQEVSGQSCYETFAALGFDYGPGQRGLRAVKVGNDFNGQRYVIAEVMLPACVADTSDQYVLHPSVLDSALQATLGLALGEHGGISGQQQLPFALQELTIFDRTPAQAFVYVRSDAGSIATDGLQKLDIDVCDIEGRVCARLKGFMTRVLEDATGVQTGTTLLLQRHWVTRDISEDTGNASIGSPHWALLDGSIYAESAEELKAAGIRVERLSGLDSDLSSAVESMGKQVLARLQELLKSSQQPVTLQIVLREHAETSMPLCAFAGLLKSARLEHPRLTCQVLSVPASCQGAALLSILSENLRDDQVEVRYRDGQRHVRQLQQLVGAQSSQPSLPWKQGGVYLITGGAGGLGRVIAREIVDRARGSQLILVGRREPGEWTAALLEELSRNESQAEYWSVDVTDEGAVRRCVDEIVQLYSRLDGVIHAAGVLRDSFLSNKNAAELTEVLGPKVAGTIALDRATSELALDLFVLFSSVSAELGSIGQADYALANAFADRYAEYRAMLVEKHQRHGRTVSIGWPLWADGGMQVDEATARRMRMHGMYPLPAGAGLQALYTAYDSDVAHALVLHGEERKLQVLFQPPAQSQSVISTAATHTPVSASAELFEKVQLALMGEICELLKVSSQDVDAQTEFGELGFDSISLTQLSNTLNERYGLSLAPTIFFEHPTVRGLTEHLIRSQAQLLSEKLMSGVRLSASVATEPQAPVDTAPARRSARAVAARSAKWRGRPAERAVGPEPIAIIGLSGCFPQAADVASFWENLKHGRDCITEIPKERWDWRALYGDPLNEPNKTNIKWAACIEGIEYFDPLFFGISPREAQVMDPQQRLLLMHVWKAIEDAGYSAQALSGSATGVFIGTASSGYSELVGQSGAPIEGYSATGAVASVGPNRVSYFLNLHGPSEPIETACSSSLVAIHRGVRAMHSGDCEMALVGGINTFVVPSAHISFNKAGMLCEDGRCKTFSRQANGYVRGEGVGILLLKRLSAAQRDGDHIYAVIRGSNENHGGRANSLTAPNPQAQAELIKGAYQQAGIDPRTVGYIEAHGTGTALGDPIEVNGLKSAFESLYAHSGDPTVAAAHCGLGSVKTNIGHLELAAGVAGVIKVLLQMKHRTLVKTLHCEELNPYIELQGSPFYVVNETMAWPALQDGSGRDLPRRAGVSSFGFGGVNAHVVLEEYVEPQARAGLTDLSTTPALIVLSAKRDEALKERVRQLLSAVSSMEESALLDIAYTLQVGRDAMEHRLAFQASSVEHLRDTLRRILADDVPAGVLRGRLKHGNDGLAFFSNDEDLQRTIEQWIAHGKFTKLLELWVRGGEVRWQQLYPAVKPRRVSLPTYAFAKERYWMDTFLAERVAAAQTAEAPRTSVSLAEPGASIHTEHERAPMAKPRLSLQPKETLDTAPASIRVVPRSTHEPQVASLRTSAGTGEFADAVERTQHLQQRLTTSLAAMLFLNSEQIDADAQFRDLGLDSVTGIEWIRAINKEHGVALPATRLYDHPTVRELARFLAAHPGEMPKASEPDSGPTPLDEILQGVYNGRLPLEEAASLLERTSAAQAM